MPVRHPPDTAPTKEAAKAETPLKLSIMLPIFKTNYPKDDSPVAAELEKITNSDIHFEWVPNASYVDKFNITLASGKLPTIMYVPDVKSPSFVNAAKSGAFWELGSYLKDYPNLSGANPGHLKQFLHRREKLRHLPGPRAGSKRRLLQEGLAGQRRTSRTGDD